MEAKAPVLKVVSRFTTRDRAVDLAGSPPAAAESPAVLKACATFGGITSLQSAPKLANVAARRGAKLRVSH